MLTSTSCAITVFYCMAAVTIVTDIKGEVEVWEARHQTLTQRCYDNKEDQIA